MTGWDEYDAARHLLRAPFIRERTAKFVRDDDFEWTQLFEASEAWSTSERLFVQAAFDLWSGGRELDGRRNVRLDDAIRTLDWRNYARLVEAMLIREGLIRTIPQLERVRSLLQQLAIERGGDDTRSIGPR